MTKADHIYEVRLGWADVYALPNTFSKHVIRLKRGTQFKGHEARGARVNGSDIWIARDAGGFISGMRVRDLGEPVMTNQEWQTYLASLPPELTDLAMHLMERINTVLGDDRLYMLGELQHMDQRLETLQRHIEAIDVRLAELACEREVGE